MPRRHVASRKTAKKGVMIGDKLANRFINIIMQDGKKSVAEKMFNDAMDLIKDKTGADPMDVFKRAISNVKPSLEVKSRRVGGSTYQVPVEVSTSRSRALSIRWIILNARKRSERGFAYRLAGELLDASNHSGSAWKKKEDTHKMAEANKAFSHYRW